VRRPALIFGPLLVFAFGLAPVGAEGTAIALFPTQNRAGDSAAVAVVDQTLRDELSRLGRLIGPEQTRDALRRLRIRNGDRAAPALLQQLGEELAADWLVLATFHDADRRLVPRLTVSARVYAQATGELVWVGFQGGSGIDGRKLLGLGAIQELEGLVPVVVRKLLRNLPGDPREVKATSSGRQRFSGSGLGKVAVVPLAGATARRGTPNAETVTEAMRARLFADGVDLVSPNTSYEALRRLQGGQWGGVTAVTRTALHETAGADTILTGAVEAYAVGGSELEPEPRVAIAMRLLDAATGDILWTGWLERSGWDRGGPFGLGRIYSRGALTENIVETLAQRLDREGFRMTNQSERR